MGRLAFLLFVALVCVSAARKEEDAPSPAPVQPTLTPSVGAAASPTVATASPPPPPSSEPTVQAQTVGKLKPAIIAKPQESRIQLPPLPLEHPLQDIGEVDPNPEDKDSLWLSHEDDNDPEVKKLNYAMDSVREEMITTSHQLNKELKWIDEVNKVMDEYEKKIKFVQDHIHQLRVNIKQLYHKKLQLKNLRIQHALEMKLKEAQDELLVLSGSMKNVRQKDMLLSKSKADLQQTINSITEELDKLKTTQQKEREKELAANLEAENQPAPIADTLLPSPTSTTAEVITPKPAEPVVLKPADTTPAPVPDVKTL